MVSEDINHAKFSTFSSTLLTFLRKKAKKKEKTEKIRKKTVFRPVFPERGENYTMPIFREGQIFARAKSSRSLIFARRPLREELALLENTTFTVVAMPSDAGVAFSIINFATPPTQNPRGGYSDVLG